MFQKCKARKLQCGPETSPLLETGTAGALLLSQVWQAMPPLSWAPGPSQPLSRTLIRKNKRSNLRWRSILQFPEEFVQFIMTLVSRKNEQFLMTERGQRVEMSFSTTCAPILSGPSRKAATSAPPHKPTQHSLTGHASSSAGLRLLILSVPQRWSLSSCQPHSCSFPSLLLVCFPSPPPSTHLPCSFQLLHCFFFLSF